MDDWDDFRDFVEMRYDSMAFSDYSGFVRWLEGLRTELTAHAYGQPRPTASDVEATSKAGLDEARERPASR